LACYGARCAFAPNLDKLAAQSVVFEQAYVTHPICTPSRSSLLTGTWPHANGCTQNNRALDPHFRCLPEMLGDSEYRTGYMGKWHLGDELSAQHKFEEWVSIMDSYKANRTPGRSGRTISDYSEFLRENGFEPDDKENGVFSLRFATTLPLEFSKPKFLENKACDFLERHRREPFVLFVSFFEPHPPYEGPFHDAHPLSEIDLDPTVDHVFSDDMPLRYRLRQEFYAQRFGTSAEEYRKIKQKYLGLVTEIDLSIGVILSKLEQLGLADNTIVAHTSDHGDMMGAHRLFGKGVLFQPAARVPYFVRMPDQRRTFSIPQTISHIDFVPTMLELLGAARDKQCAGKSRAPLMRGETMPPETIFMEWAPARRAKTVEGTKLANAKEIERVMQESSRAAISPEGWKLCLRDADKSELYDLRSDPHEQRNLFYLGEQKEMIARLSAEIHTWQEMVDDKLEI
jgi:arylsulfatase A-like enzyme